MSDQQQNETSAEVHPTQDAPQPSSARRSRRRTITAAAIGVLAGILVGVVGFAIVGHHRFGDRHGPGQHAGPGHFGGPGGPNAGALGGSGGRPGGIGLNRMGTHGATHGERVVSDGNGGRLTELMQVGKVTAIDSRSLTATSDDGYSQVYAIDGTTVIRGGSFADLANGDTVFVLAKKAGDKTTATVVAAGDQRPAGFIRRR